MREGILTFMTALDFRYKPQKIPLVSKVLSATPSGVTSSFPGRVIRDKNRITWKFFMGNGQNLVGRKPLESFFEQDRLNPGDPGLSFS